MNKIENPPWIAFLFSAIAGGMGWGIRGQYGHETGAMLAGLLVALVLVNLYGHNLSSLSTARAVALATIAIGFGGSMTYGQTLGLTQDVDLIGNYEALRWGLLGTFIKGSIWIGFFGLFLGLGLSKINYKFIEIALAMISAIFMLYIGIFLLNEPFDPTAKKLPMIYFSDHWYWEPNETLKPRREQWGGLLFALGWLISFVNFIKKDTLARNMSLWGMLAGGLGFSIGQGVQSYHAWNIEAIKTSWLSDLEPYINWWNMMEITFGAVFGFVIAFGLWLNRHHIGHKKSSDNIHINFNTEMGLLAIHILAIASWNFISFSTFDWFADRAITMGLIPIFCIITGKYWPYLVCLPITAFPIAGKTLKHMAYRTNDLNLIIGWVFILIIPITIAIWFNKKVINDAVRHDDSLHFTRLTLIFSTLFYFIMNWTIFRFPWPWTEWTNRTFSGIIFIFCASGLLFFAQYFDSRNGKWQFKKRSWESNW